jgi:hypothetical protein
LIVQGSLGGWVIPQPTTHVGLGPIPQPIPRLLRWDQCSP